MAQLEGHSPRAKKRKIDSDKPPGDSFVVTSDKQLRDLLFFRQNQIEAKQGINKFKEFLLSIGPADEADKVRKFGILKSFCDSQISHAGGGDGEICFPDLIQTWNFAENSNHEPLLTVVPSVLAIFLKTVSRNLNFRDFGIALCKSLLQGDQLKLFNRGLTATKSKEHLISPCLRLLTEVASFDGGAVAQQLYAKRYITFKRIDVFLTPNKSQLGDADDPQKSTLRRNAQRYVLANLKFQRAATKIDVVEQYKIMKAFFEYVRKDSREIILDIIKAVDSDIIQDSSLPRSAKTKFFNRWNLEKLVTLYGYDKESREPDSDTSIANEVHKILVSICTNSEQGVLLQEAGWYPHGCDPESLPAQDNSCIELGLDSPSYVDKYQESVPVRNGILSYLTQILRPDADMLQIELLIAIFKAAPELVADFFTKKTMFVSDPKPTSSWMAESAFLFSIVQTPVLGNCGWRKAKMPVMPPPVSVVIESVLPRPLTQRILSRCLNQNAELITLFAVRILTISFNKLRDVRKLFLAGHDPCQPLWNQALEKLDYEFCRRCPPVKDVILLYKRTAREDLRQQEAVAELLACFYETIPQVALKENFDVSLVLVDILQRLDYHELQKDDSDLLLSQLKSVLKIAGMSGSMRWWQQPASMQYTPFTSILRVLVRGLDESSSQEIHGLLRSVLDNNHVLQRSAASFASLMSSFQLLEPENLHSQLVFLDNCIVRTAKKPVHYQELADSFHQRAPEPISPLVAAIVEQWPYVVKTSSAAAQTAVGFWICRLLGHLKHAGESKNALKAARDQIYDATGDKKIRSRLKKALKTLEEVQKNKATEADPVQMPSPDSPVSPQDINLEEMFEPLPKESETHKELLKWEKGELDAAIERGHVAELMLCLCSEHEEVRKQSYANITRLMSKLKESQYAEWRTIYLLCGELLETVNKHFDLKLPVPWIVGQCAASCLPVVINPLHKVYGKVNKFLQRSPCWQPEKIPSYWIDKILLHEPELDEGSFDELNWLLDLFVQGLRTEADMNIYRHANVFERAFALYGSTSVEVAKRKIQHLLYRASQVGGSTTLITRAAAISWIQCQMSSANHKEASALAAIARRLYTTCDQERVDRWSGGAMEGVVQEICELQNL